MYRPRRLHRAILAAGLFLCLLTRIAAAEQFNTPDGSNYGSTDSAFKLYWDSTTDTLKLYAAPSGNAGNPITWVEGLTMDTGGASLFQVGIAVKPASHSADRYGQHCWLQMGQLFSVHGFSIGEPSRRIPVDDRAGDRRRLY